MNSYMLLVLLLVNVMANKQCYWDSTPYKYFGGKTLYDDVRGDIRNATHIQGCEPISIWILSRHGARNPGQFNIQYMKETIRLKEDILSSHAEGRGELCNQDISNLEAWKWNDTIDSTPYFLTSRGYRELRELGGRINETFYTLLKDLHVHYIRATDEQRTVESAKSFISGLDKKLGYTLQDPMGKREDVVLLVMPRINKSIQRQRQWERIRVLRPIPIPKPYSNCEIHLREAWNGTLRIIELQKYYETEDYKQLLQNLQSRTGLRQPLSVNDTSGLYDMCRFHRSFSETARSPWCALFSTQDLEVLEYAEDLRHYFRSGYGVPLNSKLGELVLKDLLEKFQATVHHSQPSFTAYFSHDSLIEMVYGALKLFRDEEGVSGERRNPQRKWRTSVNTPFAANILAVLYNCSEPVSSSSYRVKFFANERPLKICEETCSWPAFENKFRPFVNSSLSFCTINNS